MEKRKKRSPIAFFIDELDRCRPDYAVRLLERLKHLFSIAGVFFVLAVDRQQLEASVQGVYGANLNATGYPRKFIDLRYPLPQLSTEEFARALIERFDLAPVLQQLGDGSLEDLVVSFEVLTKTLASASGSRNSVSSKSTW